MPAEPDPPEMTEPAPAASRPARVAHLAFDACDATIVTELAAAGELPTFARVLREGRAVRTVAPTGVYPSAIWPTFFTACTPDDHRYYSWSEVAAGDYETRLTDPSEIRGEPYFVTLSDRGRRVAIIDLPHTRPVEGLDGVMLSEWGCHDRHGGAESWPPGLLAELDERIGRHPVGGDAGPGLVHFDPSDYLHRTGSRRSTDEVERLFADLCKGHARKRALTLSLLDEGGWDLFSAVFSEGHCTGHQLWHVHDERHPWHEPADRERIGSPIVEMYRRFDDTLAAHLDRLGPDTPVFVHLSHGMGPHYDGTDVLEHVLRLVDDPTAAGRTAALFDRLPAGLRSAPARAAAKAGPVGSAWLRWLASRPRTVLADLPPESLTSEERRRRRWFVIPNNTVTGAVRLNVAGRDPDGCVEPGAAYDAACEELAGLLAELVNVDTGEPLVLSVTRADAVHRWSEHDPFPDVLVEWNRRAPIERVWSPRFGAIEVPRTHWRTGDHTEHGLFVALGPGIEPGPVRGPVGVEHLAPTIAAALGEALPDVAGRPIAGLVGDPTGLPADQVWLDPPDAATAPAPAGSRWERLRATVREDAARRARAWLDLPELERRVDDVAGSVAVLSDANLDVLRQARWATDLAGHAQSHARAAQEHSEFVNASVEAVARHLGEADERVAELDRLAEGPIRRLLREAQIRTTMDWIELVEQPEDLLVTVIMPTYNRASHLPRAIASLVAQDYANWELIVVDDGSTDGTAAVLAAIDDERVRTIRGDHGGCSAARNLALEQVKGDVVVYLDDDNVMHPRWLKSVAWAFGQRPDVDVVMGARVIDDVERVHDWRTSGGMPWIQFEPYDRERLEQGNVADIGVIAHRAGLPDARFDEQLVSYGDWDLFLRLTRDKDPLELPAIAIAYATDAPDRLSAADLDADHDRVQANLRAAADADLGGEPDAG
jgi:predicted AlkP superfamily phosphohydrolase/phosphomutase